MIEITKEQAMFLVTLLETSNGIFDSAYCVNQESDEYKLAEYLKKEIANNQNVNPFPSFAYSNTVGTWGDAPTLESLKDITSIVPAIGTSESHWVSGFPGPKYGAMKMVGAGSTPAVVQWWNGTEWVVIEGS